MKTLYLVRHAKSDWEDLSLKDFDRPLNTRGLLNAPKVGLKLKEEGEVPQLVVASPAKRTTQTAETLCEQMEIDVSLIKYIGSIYEASTRELLQVINNLNDQFDSVMIVCHNMAISYIAEYLTGNDIGNIPTCGVFKISFDFDEWLSVSEKTGEEVFFWKPKELDF